MLQGRTVAIAGVAVLVVLVAAVAVFQVIQIADRDDNGLAAPPAAPEPNGTPDPGELPDLDDFDPETPATPPEVQTFLETFDLAGSVLHFTLEQEAGEAAGGVYAVGDLWIEIDEDEFPTRLVARFFDRDGELLEAFHSDGEEERIALIQATRAGEDQGQGCLQRNPASPQAFLQFLPFVVGGAMLEMEGFEVADDAVTGDGPSTNVDDRVGEPARTLAMPSWASAEQYEREEQEQPARAVVVVDPETRILMGQALFSMNDDGEELQFRQAMGDIHVHERGTADDAFDFQDAIDLCEELES